MQAEGGPDDVHAANQFATHLRQCAEHMLNAGPRRGDAPVAPLLRVPDAAGGDPFAICTRQPAYDRLCSRSMLG